MVVLPGGVWNGVPSCFSSPGTVPAMGEMACHFTHVLEGGVPLENSRVTAFLMWYGMQNSLMDGIYHVRCPLNG